MPRRGALSDDARLTSVCLSVCLTSVAYIGPKLRTERPRKTKIGTVVAHVTRNSDTTFKVKRSKVKVTCEALTYCGDFRTACLFFDLSLLEAELTKCFVITTLGKHGPHIDLNLLSHRVRNRGYMGLRNAPKAHPYPLILSPIQTQPRGFF